MRRDRGEDTDIIADIYGMSDEPAFMKDKNIDRKPFFELPHPEIIHLPDMPFIRILEELLQSLIKTNHLSQPFLLIFDSFQCYYPALFIRNILVVGSVLVQPANLSEDKSSFFVRFTVQHVGIDSADRKSVLIDTTSPVYKLNT